MHGKADPNTILAKRMLQMKDKAPQKHHSYLEKILRQLENGGL